MGALLRVLDSVDALQNLRALFLLLATFAAAGLLLAMAQGSVSRGSEWLGPVQAGAALLVAFYGGNGAGILVMDEALGRPGREISDALRASLLTAHRLVLTLLTVISGVVLVGALLVALLWLCRTAVSGPVIGPALFGLAVPVGVIGVGLLTLALTAVVVPLAAPGVWAGHGVFQNVRWLAVLVRRRMLTVALLMAVVSLLTAAVGALVTFVVMAGGRVIAELGVSIVGVDVPARQLMAGLFGHGLRSLGASALPAIAPASAAHAAAAWVGGGAVFALALVLPGLVYLRGSCAVYCAMAQDTANEGDPARHNRPWTSTSP